MKIVSDAESALDRYRLELAKNTFTQNLITLQWVGFIGRVKNMRWGVVMGEDIH